MKHLRKGVSVASVLCLLLSLAAVWMAPGGPGGAPLPQRGESHGGKRDTVQAKRLPGRSR